MIELTRLNNRPLVVNSDLIKFIENTPDTVLTLSSGEKVVVSEPCPVVIEKIVEFRRKILGGYAYVECRNAAARIHTEQLDPGVRSRSQRYIGAHVEVVRVRLAQRRRYGRVRSAEAHEQRAALAGVEQPVGIRVEPLVFLAAQAV